MSDLNANSAAFSEAVCIEAMRIFDSCSDKDCIEDLEVVFGSAEDQATIANATFIKCKSVEVVNTVFDIEPVPFNKGFFSVDLTYTFNVEIEAFSNVSLPSTTLNGVTTFSKKVILYGGDGNTKYFSSDETTEVNTNGYYSQTLPRATVSVVEPISLDCKLLPKHRFNNCGCPIQCDDNNAGDCPTPPSVPKVAYITIGLFSIVQLSRPVPILVPAYDYCIPSKECSTTTDSPCELFEKIKFPTNEFFPRSLEETEMLNSGRVHEPVSEQPAQTQTESQAETHTE